MPQPLVQLPSLRFMLPHNQMQTLNTSTRLVQLVWVGEGAAVALMVIMGLRGEEGGFIKTGTSQTQNCHLEMGGVRGEAGGCRSSWRSTRSTRRCGKGEAWCKGARAGGKGKGGMMMMTAQRRRRSGANLSPPRASVCEGFEPSERFLFLCESRRVFKLILRCRIQQ